MSPLAVAALVVACGDPAPERTAVVDSATERSTPPAAGPMALCINEFMPHNVGTLFVGATTPDWIELHNPGATDVSLDGWQLADSRTAHGYDLDPTLVVPAGGYLVFYADDDPYAGPQHLDFTLAKEGEEVVLQDPDDRISIVSYGSVVGDISIARSTDCCTDPGCTVSTHVVSPGATNAP